MTKSSVRKAARQEIRIARPLARLAPGKRTVAIARQLPRPSPRKRAVHIARPPLASRFPYDGQMPESMRALAEKSVAQTRELYVHSLEAVLES